jgi:hypothetical protein
MNRVYKFLSVVVLLGITTTSIAQKNVVKVGLIGFAFKNLKFQYERVLTPRMSVQISGSFLLNRELDSRFTDGLLEQDSNTTSVAANYITDSYMKGISVIPELRIYSKKKDGAPKGFYFGPYLKYSKYSIGYSGFFDGSYEATEGSVRSLGLGLSLGAHFLIAKRVSIDWNFISIGVNSNKFVMQYTSPGGYYAGSQEEINEIEEDIQNDFKDIPFLGNKVDVELNGNSASVTTKFWMPAIRSGLTIGVAF